MLKITDKNKIFLETFRPKWFSISNNENNVYFIKDKECFGRLVLESSRDRKEFKQNKELSDEFTTKDILNTTGLDNVYLPEYTINKINNSRRNDTLYDTIDEIIENYVKYFNFFSDLELYKIISNFFEEIYNILIDENIKLEFLYLKQIPPLYDIKYKNELTYIDLDNSYIEYLLKSKKFKSLFSELINKVGLPYNFISYIGDTIHYKNDNILNCYDDFINVGILISIIKKMNYEIDNTIYFYLEKNTNIILDNRDKIYTQLKEIVNNKYEFILSNISNIYLNENIKFNTESRDTIKIDNVIFFYYHYTFDRIDNDRLNSILKEEETNNMRNILIRNYKRLSIDNKSKENFYINLINKINKNDRDTNNYVRKLFKKRKNIEF